MPKRFLLYLGLVIAILAAVAFLSWRPPEIEHRISRQSYERIRAGMSEAEVADLLGVRAGDYTTHPTELPFCGTGDPREEYAPRVGADERIWKSNLCQIEVVFDEDGVIVSKALTPVWKRSRLEAMFDWLR